MAQRIQLRNGISSDWSTADPVLSENEIAVDTTINRIKVGDGTTNWNSLSFLDIQGNVQIFPYRSLGDGSDGDVVINSGTTTLVRDMFYNNLTISGTGRIFTNNFKIFVKGILDLTNAPSFAINNDGANGGNAANNVAGVAPLVSAVGSVGQQGQGTNGDVGRLTTGAQALAPSAFSGNGGGSNSSGAGSAGISIAGASGAGQLPTANDLNSYYTNLFRGVTIINGGAGGRGGSSGGGDSVNLSGAGGSGGNGGGVVAIYANIIVTSSLTSASAISARGGKGGNGGNATAGTCGGGGGGAGGAGGWIYFVYNKKFGPVVTNFMDASGGAGGDGGSGFGTLSGFPVLGAGGGQGGFGGRITVFEVPTSTGKMAFPPTSNIYVPGVLSLATASVDERPRHGGFSGTLYLSF